MLLGLRLGGRGRRLVRDVRGVDAGIERVPLWRVGGWVVQGLPGEVHVFDAFGAVAEVLDPFVE